MTEKELLRLCKKNNPKGQKLLYKIYHGTLMGVCMRYAKSKAEAEDILQMAMIKIFKNIDSYSGSGSFEGWMKKITVNTAVDNFRKNAKHYNHNDFEDLKDDSMLSGDIPDSLEVTDILNTIRQLPPGYRIVFNLYAIEGYSHKEIARKLGITENTSKTQLLKARKKLKQMLLSLSRLPENKVIKEVKTDFNKDALIAMDIITE